MHPDNQQPKTTQPAQTPSAARRREILRRIGQASVAAGAAASPVAALATGSPRKWCKDPVNTTKCVQASISGMGSVVLSAQASNEVCGKKCSHYAVAGNWPASCSNGSVAITCNSATDSSNTKFKVAFACAGGALDSLGKAQADPACLLNMSLPTLCASYPTSVEAHWATALGNANKLVAPVGSAPFPYTPAQVVGHFQNLAMKASAYTFYTTYCENYA